MELRLDQLEAFDLQDILQQRQQGDLDLAALDPQQARFGIFAKITETHLLEDDDG